MTRADDFATLSDLLTQADDGPEDPARATRSRRRRRVGWIAALLVFALLVGAPALYVAAALGAPLPAASVTVAEPLTIASAPVALALPAVQASAVSIRPGNTRATKCSTGGSRPPPAAPTRCRSRASRS